MLKMAPIDALDVYNNRADPTYSEMFQETYAALNSQEYEYTNEYRLKSFSTVIPVDHFKEQVFLCTIEDRLHQKIYPYYVSKEYNISPFLSLIHI